MSPIIPKSLGPWVPWLPLALFSVLWLDLIRQLSYEWSNREEYAFGWFVPFLALGLFWRRWLTRPKVGPLTTGPLTTKPPITGPLTTDHGPLTCCPVVSSPSVPETLSPYVPESAASGLVVSGLVVSGLVLLLPLRVIHEINQDWPLITWPYALIVVALTLYAFHLADPQSDVPESLSPYVPKSAVRTPISAFYFLLSAFNWRRPLVPESLSPYVPKSAVRSPISAFYFLLSAFNWRRPYVPSPRSVVSGQWSLSPWVTHFAFPICFILVAVSWPYRIEHGLTQGLMHGVTALTVTILGWVDILASQHGNVIEISTGVVGIDEACSGIRSFQSMIMGALFLGELYRLRWPHRLALIGSGVVVAFGLNVVRTFILTWCASDAGTELVGKWHDPAGLSIFLASFACLWLLARRLEKHCAALDEADAPGYMPPPGVRSAEGAVQSLKSNVQSPVVSGQWSVVRSPWSVVRSQWSVVSGQWSSSLHFMAVVGFWSLCVLGLNELWYRAHGVKEAGVFHWAISFPESLPTFAKIELPQRTARLLSYNSGAAGRWHESDGSDWSAYFFRWNTGSVQSLIRARLHRPEVCLPLSGSRQLTPSQLLWIEAGHLKLPFRLSVYDIDGARTYVFFCLWEDGAETQRGLWVSPQADRIRSVLAGRRRLGQQTCELVLSGYASKDAAEQALRKQLPELVRLDPAQPGRRAERKAFSLRGTAGEQG